VKIENETIASAIVVLFLLFMVAMIYLFLNF